MPEFDLFTETAAVLVAALLFSAVCALLRQPLIVAYIFTGVVVGPVGFGWVTEKDPLDLLAKMGIAILLFVVGLKLDPRLIRTLGRVVLAVTVVQVVLVATLGLGLSLLLGMDIVTALYVGLGVSFSSTVVIVKLLSDNRQINALHGRIALGMLIVQDLVVVVCMALLTAFDGEGSSFTDILMLPLKGLAFLAAVGLVMRYVMPSLLPRFAHSRELLLLSATAWALFLSASGHGLGFSHEVGAFVAGVSLAATPFHDAIGARLTALRDFLLLFFFVDLGAHVNLGYMDEILLPTLVLSAFALLLKPILTGALLLGAGYNSRTATLTGLTLGQISEFSLILAAMGMAVGHLDAQAVSMMTLTALITITASSYLIRFLYPVYDYARPFLKRFERAGSTRETASDLDSVTRPELMLLGLGRFGKRMALGFQRRGLPVLGVDFDPDILDSCRRLGVPVHFGDVSDPDLLGTLPLDGTLWVVSCIPDTAINRNLVQTLKGHGYRGYIAAFAQHPDDEAVLTAAGVHLVLQPFNDAADQAVDLVTGHDIRPFPLGGQTEGMS
ncbi:MAG: cation:proton antiporter [Leptospirillia bacterium]